MGNALTESVYASRFKTAQLDLSGTFCSSVVSKPIRMFHQFPLTNKRRHLFDRKKLHLLSTLINRRDSVMARRTLRSELTFKWETGVWSLVFNLASYISELAFNCYFRYWGTDLRVLSDWYCYQQRDWEPVVSKTIRMFRQFPLTNKRRHLIDRKICN